MLTLSDLVLAVGRRANIIEAGRVIGPETPAVPGLDTPLATTQVSLTDKGVSGKSLDTLSREHPEFSSGGVYVTDVLRNDQHLPATPRPSSTAVTCSPWSAPARAWANWRPGSARP